MNIQELSNKTGDKHVTVTLTYDEVRDMANGLYYVSKDNPEYKGIKDKCKFLFDMVKDGMILHETVVSMCQSELDRRKS